MYSRVIVKYGNTIVKDDNNRTIGTLYFRRGRDLEWQEFRYDDFWIEHGFQIDPELPLSEEMQRASLQEFACFSDVSPDSWGRALIKRYFSKNENRSVLFASEYLLSVSDEYRIGAFQFYDENDTLISLTCNTIPYVKDLKSFQYTISRVQKGLQISDSDFLDIVNYGSSLGGARPKLTIKDEKNNSLWLAKFGSIMDMYDVPAREAISLFLAKKCHLNLPDFTLIQLDFDKSVLLIKRFDREMKKRIPFLSAKTFLKAIDGESNNYSYLDIAGIIESTSYMTAKQDLAELFRRLIFNVLSGNKDDHLRNHGFLYTGKGWRLSPVYDLEIAPEKSSHSLALDDKGSLVCDITTLVEMAEYYGIAQEDAKEMIFEIASLLYDWEKAAKELGIPRRSSRKMPVYTVYSDEIQSLRTRDFSSHSLHP